MSICTGVVLKAVGAAVQGKWTAPLIDNPNFVDDPDLYKLPPLKYVAFELWQVKAGTIFDNIMVTDSLDEALQFAKDTWGKHSEAEKAMFEKVSVRPAAPRLHATHRNDQEPRVCSTMSRQCM